MQKQLKNVVEWLLSSGTQSKCRLQWTWLGGRHGARPLQRTDGGPNLYTMHWMHTHGTGNQLWLVLDVAEVDG